jgi:hypothetical protein
MGGSLDWLPLVRLDWANFTIAVSPSGGTSVRPEAVTVIYSGIRVVSIRSRQFHVGAFEMTSEMAIRQVPWRHCVASEFAIADERMH